MILQLIILPQPPKCWYSRYIPTQHTSTPKHTSTSGAQQHTRCTPAHQEHTRYILAHQVHTSTLGTHQHTSIPGAPQHTRFSVGSDRNMTNPFALFQNYFYFYRSFKVLCKFGTSQFTQRNLWDFDKNSTQP